MVAAFLHSFLTLVLGITFALADYDSVLVKRENRSIVQQHIPKNFSYKGVALGGWLVLEPYITPSLFLEFNKTSKKESDIPVDEYHYCKKLGPIEAKKRLTSHWSTFYTEKDFSEIKKLGLNMVRIPVGYWSFEKLDDDPYISGAQEYLDKAISWAHKYDLRVWIDLHGAPGSQNGFDNSGLRNISHPGWFKKEEYVETTHRVLKKIFAKYGGSNFTSTYQDTIIGIELVNEPLSTELSIKKIKSFYETGYKNAREIQMVNNSIVLHDAFKAIGYWDDFMSKGHNNYLESYYNILIDHHHYAVFSSQAMNQSMEEHIDAIKSYSTSILKELKHHPAVVGEWLAALTDCTPWLNGVGLGARYAGEFPYTNDKIGTCNHINDWSSWSDTQKKNQRKFIEIQLDQYQSKSNGWIFWCYKTETSIEWDFKRLVELDLMPQPLSERKYIINGTDTDNSEKKSMGSRVRPVPCIFYAISIFQFFHSLLNN